MKATRRFEIYSKIRWNLERHKHATPRELGMTEQEFRELADGAQFYVEKLEETGYILDNHVISRLLQPAEDFLANPPQTKTDWVRVGVWITLGALAATAIVELFRKG